MNLTLESERLALRPILEPDADFCIELPEVMRLIGPVQSPEQVVAVTNRANLSSQNVLKKAGSTDEGLRYACKTQYSSFRLTRARWRTQDPPDG